MHRRQASIIVCSFTIISMVAGAQQATPDSSLANTDQSNFFEVQEAVNAYYVVNPDAPGQKQWRRYEWFMEPRLYPSGDMDNLTLKTFLAQERYFAARPEQREQRSTHGGWLFVGPADWVAAPTPADNNGLGRINSIDLHPTDDQIIYAGTASGGLWKTLNGGASWTNISPHIPLLSVADVEIDPGNPDIIYLLTGDGEPSSIDITTAHSQSGASSLGILKSTDGGSTWYPTAFSFDLPSDVEPHKLLMHPTDPMIQFVASQQGIFKTIDGWDHWTQVSWSITFDIEFKPNDPDVMYASGTKTIWRSTTAGDIWTAVTDPDLAVFTTSSRIELAVTPDFEAMVYAIGGNALGYLATMQSLLEGIDNSWIIKDSSATIFGAFAFYCIAMAVSPTDYHDVFAGMQGLGRNFSQGQAGSWTGINPGHADIHDIQIRNGVVYCAHDGGLYKSSDDGTSWTEISQGIACTEVYTVTGTPQNANLYILGAQDVGHLKKTSGSSVLTTIGCCDGMISLIDYTDQNTIYIAGQYGGINKSTTGLPPFTAIGNPGDKGAWNTPYIMDPVDPEILFVGKDSVHRTDDGGGSWQYLGSPSVSNLNVLAQGVNNRNRLYVSSFGTIWRTDNALVSSGTATWTPVSSGLPNLFITGIAINPDDADEVFITMSGYSAGEKVFKSTVGGSGSAWTNISGSLPNVPINCIVYHDDGTSNDAIYVGTDIGVFYRDNTLGDWIYYSNFMPSVSVSDLYINTTSNVIVAGTYGRGLWASDLYDACDPSILLSFGPQGGVRHYSAGTDISSSVEHRFDLGTEIHYTAGGHIDLTPGFLLGGLAYFEGKIAPCPPIFTESLISPFVPSGNLVLTGQELQGIRSRDD
ncbi:MAG: hypothetical protein R3330_00170 [Saprospiraceae bacterium]|nr:hypothetical protein [Saprospiraceae bacterium]